MPSEPNLSEREPALPGDLIPLADAARMLPGRRRGQTRHVQTVYKLVRSGKLPAWKLGGRLLVSEAAVRALFVPVTVPPAAPRGPTRAQQDARTAATLRRFGITY